MAAGDELAQGRWRRPSGTWHGGTGAGARRPAGAGAATAGIVRLCLPASAGTSRRRPRRRSGCGPRRGAGDGAARPRRGVARAGADQPRHYRVLGGRARGGRAAPGTGPVLAHRIGRPFSRSPAWPTSRRPRATGRSRGRRSTACRPSSWPSGTAGPTSRPRAPPTGPRRAGLAGAAGGGSPWVQRAERVLRAEAEPAAVLGVQYIRGLLELGRGRCRAGRFPGRRAAGRRPRHAAIPPPGGAGIAGARPGAPGRNGACRAGPRRVRRPGPREICIAAAVLRLARHDPRAALAALAPVLDGSAPLLWPTWLTMAFPAGGDRPGRRSATGVPPIRPGLERALDLDRARRRAGVFPSAHPSAGTAAAPRPGLRQARGPGFGDPHSAFRAGARRLRTRGPHGRAGPEEVRRSGEPPRDQEGPGALAPRG